MVLPFGQGSIWLSLLWRSSTPFWFHPGRGSHFVAEQLAEAPNVVSQPARHRRRACHAPLFRLREFLMDDTEIVGTANQVHACVQSMQARSGVPTLAGHARQSLSKRSIQAFNKGCIENLSPLRKLKQLLGLLKEPIISKPFK